MKILVTGGAGFIGGNFIHYMLNKYNGYKIICIDSLTYAGDLETLEQVMDNENFSFYKVDITDREKVNQLFERELPDIVVNFAAESHVDRSIENPNVFLTTNIIGTNILLDACNKYGIKRYHQVSTDEVYGDLPLDRPDLLFTESTPIHTSSPYSASKASADLLVLAYHRTFNTPVTISRCSNNYGPYQFPEKLIPLMISKAMNNENLPVYGNGLNVRDWLYVEDHCKAIDLIIHNGRIGEVYNIGGHNEKTNIDIVKIILKELNKSEDLITYVQDRKGHDMRYAIDPTKIHNELGWLPETKFEDGIKKTIKWYLENSKWWKNILSGEYLEYNQKICENNTSKKFKFTKTFIEDLIIVEPTVFGDDRGYFMESYNDEFLPYIKHIDGSPATFVQDNQSRSKKGVLRGLHFQKTSPQGKLVRVIEGEVFDVAVDLRKNSKTYGKWYGIILSAENKKQFYVPEGFAHGFLVLSDYATFCYKCTRLYNQQDEGGLLYNDSDINIEWPKIDAEILLSEKDKKHKQLKDLDFSY